MRLLLASTSGAGHIGPLLPFAEAGHLAGDEVEVVVPADSDPSLEALGVRITRGGVPPKSEMDRLWARFAGAGREEQRRLAEREIFATRFTQAMLPSLSEVTERRRPDLVLREPCEYASVIAAHRAGVRFATVAISFAAAEWGVLDLVADLLDRERAGIVDAMRASPFLTRFPPSLDPSPFPATIRYRDRRPIRQATAGGDPWRGRPHPHLYLTFGSLLGAIPAVLPIYAAAVAAMAGLDAQVLFTVGRRFDPSSLGPLPENVTVADWVPQEDVLADCDAVLCHGGSGTTWGALAHGLPIGFIPLFADQPANAWAVAGAGAGLVLEGRQSADGVRAVGAPDVPAIRAMAELLLGDESYRLAARRLAHELAGQPSLTDSLEALTSPAQGTGAAGSAP